MKSSASRPGIVVTAVVLGSVLSCMSEPTGTANLRPQIPAAAPRLMGNQLLACTPMTADSVTQVVGPLGGTLSVGPHQLIVPAGALDSAVSITALAPTDTVNRVVFYPEGLTFNTPVSLKLSYANCGLLSALIPKYVVYLDGLNINTVLTSLDSYLHLSVTGSIEHFSGYAVAW
jgi:hypothetical protein